MRVLHLSSYKPAWKLGGPVNSVSRLCEGLAALGVDVEVISTDNAGGGTRLDVPLGRPCDVDGVKVTYLKEIGPSMYYFAPQLPFVLHQMLDKFDILHISAFWTFFQVGSAFGRLGSKIPVVLSPRGALMPYAMGCRGLKKQVYLGLIERPITRKYDAIHCTTEMEREAVRKYFPAVPSFVIPNSLRIEGFRHLPPRGAFRNRLGLPEDRFVFLYLSRIHPLKGLDLTIRALSTARKRGYNVDLLVAGSPHNGSLTPWTDLVAETGVTGYVHFVGHVDANEKLQCLADADAFVLNSHSENFCVSVVEAVASGLPCLISDQIGVADWVSSHNAGLVVPQDANLIAESMMRMVESRESFAGAALKARQAAGDSFDHLAVARRMLKQYEAILSTGHPTGD
jgi:glycosyltransferase involved in cell wall biosynthesis